MLVLTGGGSHTDIFAGSGTLEFGGGVHTLQSGASITVTNVMVSGSAAVTAQSGSVYNLAGSSTTVSAGALITSDAVRPCVLM